MADMPDYEPLLDDTEDSEIGECSALRKAYYPDEEDAVDDMTSYGTAVNTAKNALTANRSVHGKATQNTFNQAVQCYVNVGAWTGGRTDICVVSGSEVALCSWNAPPDADKHKVRGDRAKYAKDKPKFSPSGKVTDFIQSAGGANKWFTLLGGYIAPGGFKFTADTEAIIFLPDSHMNMFRESYCDAFCKPQRTALSGKASMVTDLLAFLNFYQGWKGSNCPGAKLVHLGDRVDIWHVQAVCLDAHRYLQELVDQYEKEHGKGTNPNIPVYHDANYYVVDRKKVKPSDRAIVTRQIKPSNWPKQVDVFDALALFIEKNNLLKRVRPDGSLKGVVVDYSDYQSVEAAIQGRYPEITSGHWQLFDKLVRGNHDMDLNHPYLADRYKYPLDKPYLKSAGKPADPWWDDWDDTTPKSTSPYGNVIGTNDCIWYEHGHAFDPYNHRGVFHREDKRAPEPDLKMRVAPPIQGGFMSTLGFVRDAFTWEGVTGKSKANPGSLFYKASGIAGDVGLEFYAYHRTRKIFDKHGKGKNGEKMVNLVVMGHTHVPHIEDFASWQSGWRYAVGAMQIP